MATWTLYLMETPLNTVSGTGIITPLTLASGISMGYKVDDIDTLTFSVPGRHFQTALIKESMTDIIAYRDDEVVQRFRVVSMSLQGRGTDVQVAVTCSAYREVINAWMFHDAIFFARVIGNPTGNVIQYLDAGEYPLAEGDPVFFLNVAPALGIENGRIYYVHTIMPGGEDFQIAESLPGPPLDIPAPGPRFDMHKYPDKLDYPGVMRGPGTFTDTGDLVTTTDMAHGLSVNDPVDFGAITTTTGVVTGQTYYVKTVPSSTTFTIATTAGGSTVTLTTDGSTTFVRTFTDAGNNPVNVAWSILNEGQTKNYGDINATVGVVPTVALVRRAYESVSDTADSPLDASAHYFSPEQTRADGINQISQLDGGFEWSLDPDPADPFAALKFNTWNRDGRYYAVGGLSDFVLSEATMATWTLTRDMADYANVIRVSPNAATVDGTVGGLDVPVWRPDTRDPLASSADPDATLRGRWEKGITSTQYMPELVAKYADEQLVKLQDRSTGMQCTIQAGRWEGPSDFWLGDSMRMLLRVALVDDDNRPTGEYLIDVDAVVRAVGISISVGVDGSEQVSLELNRTTESLMDVIYALRDDVSTLKRK